MARKQFDVDTMYKEVRLLKPYNGVQPGNVLTVSRHEYRTLIDNGTAVPHRAKPTAPDVRKDIPGPDETK